MPGGLAGALSDFFHTRFGPHAQQARTQGPSAGTTQAPASSGSGPSGSSGQSPIPTFNDPIVSSLNQQLAQEQSKPVPTEAEQLKQEQHSAWGNYDFERCIVIFSRLHELEPDNPDWPDKLKTSYYNRGKQYEQEGNIQRATQCYYAALQIDPSFEEAQQAAQEMLQKQGAATSA